MGEANKFHGSKDGVREWLSSLDHPTKSYTKPSTW
jgi:hypothetical protein